MRTSQTWYGLRGATESDDTGGGSGGETANGRLAVEGEPQTGQLAATFWTGERKEMFYESCLFPACLLGAQRVLYPVVLQFGRVLESVVRGDCLGKPAARRLAEECRERLGPLELHQIRHE